LSLIQREQRLRDTGQTTMFDLWGDAAPVPLAELDMAPGDVSDREKGVWEKELMGVSFSEKPFSLVPAGKYTDAIFCGNIDVELDKQTIVTAGRVISARYLLTRDGRSFANAILEDVSGQIEVMVWPRVYAETSELWQEGNELVVQGKVRVRDDEIQISCDRVDYYQAPDNNELAAVPEPVVPKKPESKTLRPADSDFKTGEKRRLIINISQTEDAEGDIERLNRISAALKNYPGRDEVRLNIANGGQGPTSLKLPLRIDFCPELKRQLSQIISEDCIKLETIT
jgi:DNA polymerase-3 subunit alpha